MIRLEPNQANEYDIVIEGWDKGIAPSPHLGLADVRNLNINDIPGSIFASPKTTNNKPNSLDVDYLGVSRTFTADASTDIITLNSSLQQDYMVVTLTSTGTLPAGLSTSTNYYLRLQTATTFKLATSLANAINGTYVNITSAGSGTHTATVTDMGNIQATAKDMRSGYVYAVDHNCRVWVNAIPGGSSGWMLISGNTLTQGTGNGIAVWQNYLFVFRSSAIDVFGALDDWSTASWSNSWQTMNANTSYTGYHKALVGSDNILYWTDFANAVSGSQRLGYVGSLKLAGASAFAPGTGATFTYNNNALDFPSDEEPSALTELNTYLVITTNFSGVNSNGNYSKLYWWDRVSASYFNPIIIPESPVYELANANNIIYIFCGYRGRVYQSNLTSIEVAFKIPDHLYLPGNTSTGYEGRPIDASAVSQTGSNGGSSSYYMTFARQARVTRRKMYFGVNLYGATSVFSYDVESKALQIEATPLNGVGSTGTSSTQITAVETLNSSLFTYGTEIIWFGTYYSSGTTTYTCEKWNIFSLGSSSNFSSYNGQVVSELIPIGTYYNKKTLQQLEYNLDRNMISGSGIKISYRKALGDSWTVLATDEYSSLGALLSRAIDFPSANDCEYIQIKVELNRATILKDIRLR